MKPTRKALRKKIALALAIASIAAPLTACGKEKVDPNGDPRMALDKSEILAEYDAAIDENIRQATRIEELERMLKGVQGEDVQAAAITEFSDGTGRLTLLSDDGLVQLPGKFEYPSSIQAANASSVKITDSVFIKPSSNWVVTLNGTEIHFQHTIAEISGTIKVGGYASTLNRPLAKDTQQHLIDFFSTMPPETVSYQRIYIETDHRGTDCVTHTFIDEEDAMLRCGIFGSGDYNFSYMFCYRGERDVSKDELIMSLLQSITVFNKSFRIE